VRAAEHWAALAAQYPASRVRCLGCGALDEHPIKGPLEPCEVLIYEGVLLPAMRCKYCETPLLAVEGRAWLQFKQRKEMARGYR
jgi:hypothetical protein